MCPTNPSDILEVGDLRPAAARMGRASEAEEDVGKWTRAACIKGQWHKRRTVLSILEHRSEAGKKAVKRIVNLRQAKREGCRSKAAHLLLWTTTLIHNADNASSFSRKDMPRHAKTLSHGGS